MGLGIVESVAFGLGVVFLIFGLRLVHHALACSNLAEVRLRLIEVAKVNRRNDRRAEAANVAVSDPLW